VNVSSFQNISQTETDDVLFVYAVNTEHGNRSDLKCNGLIQMKLKESLVHRSHALKNLRR